MKKTLQKFIFIIIIFSAKGSTAQTWSALGSGFNLNVLTLISDPVQPTVLYTGGDFTNYGHIAKWNGSAWSSIGSINGQVRALEFFNGNLIAGGNFTMAGGQTVSAVAQWNGASWSAMGLNIVGTVYALRVYNNELYACGNINMGFIVKWNGTTWVPVSTPALNSSGWCMEVYNGNLYVGGNFYEAGGNPAYYIAQWNGNSWGTVGSGTSGSYEDVYALKVFNSKLYVGGSFTVAGGIPADGIATWDGLNWAAINSDQMRTVNALEIYNGSLYAGGSSYLGNGGVTNYVARLSGTTWLPMGTGTSGIVKCLESYNGALIVGGYFLLANGISVNRIASWNLPVGIAEPGLNSLNDINFYPNPATSFLNIQLPAAYEIKLLNITGQIIKQAAINKTAANEIIFDVSNCPTGIYNLSVITNDGVVNKKVMVGR